MIIFRKATMDDLPLLLKWDDAPHMLEAMPDFEWDYEEDLRSDPEWRDQLIAEVGNTPIGFVQIIEAHDEETHYWGNVPKGTYAIDIWIGEQDYIGKGYGRDMMEQALARCFAHEDCHQVLIDPMIENTAAIQFYEKIGFKFIEKRWFDEDECLVYRMTRQDWGSR